MVQNLVNITSCDNELILVASNWNESYVVANIKSGNNNSVDVSIQLAKGATTTPANLNGINGPLSGTHTVDLPAGDYRLNIVGLNWGGPEAFALSLNGTPYKYDGPGSNEPLIWAGGNPKITIA